MKLNLKLFTDYYIGGFLHFLLKPPTVILGKLLRRDHSLEGCTTVTVVKMLGGGSLVIAYPSLLAIRRLPRIQKMQLVTTPAIKPFAEMLGVFDEILLIRDNSPLTMVGDSLRTVIKLFRADVIVDLEIHSRLTTVFSVVTCARNRIGFYTSISFWRRRLSTHLVFCNISTGIYFFYEQIARLFGAEVGTVEDAIATFRAQMALVAPAPEITRGKMGLAPCCSELGRERALGPREWLEVLGRRFGPGSQGEGREIHLFGAPSDKAELESLAAGIRNAFPAVATINHAGKTNLIQSVRKLNEISELLCIDSSMIHYARLLGIPTVSFWGPTDPLSRLKPSPANHDEIHYYKLPCSPCVHLAQSPPCRGNNLCIQLAVDPQKPVDRNPVWIVPDSD